jgi:hypothetical protein
METHADDPHRAYFGEVRRAWNTRQHSCFAGGGFLRPASQEATGGPAANLRERRFGTGTEHTLLLVPVKRRALAVARRTSDIGSSEPRLREDLPYCFETAEESAYRGTGQQLIIGQRGPNGSCSALFATNGV